MASTQFLVVQNFVVVTISLLASKGIDWWSVVKVKKMCWSLMI